MTMSVIHPVVQVLISRRSQVSVPGHRQDGFRVGLAVEGGGMRGVLSGAMLSALADCGFVDSFDALYAYSAGAINSAYFVSCGGWQSLSVYYDDLVSKQFFAYRRLLGHKPLVSLDFVFDTVVEERNPLNYRRLLSSPIQLHLIASSVDQVKPFTFKEFHAKKDVKTALRASSCIPIIGGPPVVYHGERFVDGAVLLSHPFLAARADGCTHVLVIRTRSHNSSAGKLTVDKLFMAQQLERLQRGMKKAVISTIKEYSPIAAEIRAQSLSETGPPYVLDVGCPDGSHKVGRLTQNRALIYQGMRVAYGAMLEALTGCHENVLLRPAIVEGQSEVKNLDRGARSSLAPDTARPYVS
jgi:predicted patatin/cPLA2 family phospholipase